MQQVRQMMVHRIVALSYNRWVFPLLFPFIAVLPYLVESHRSTQSLIQHLTEWQMILLYLFAALFSLFIWYTDRHSREYQQELLLYKELLDLVPTDIAVFDEEHRYIYLNQEAIRDPELRSYIIGKNDLEYFEYRGYDRSIAQERMSKFREALASRQPVSWVDSIYSKGLGLRHIQRTFMPTFDETGNFKRMYGFGANVTELHSLRNKGADLAANMRYANMIQRFLMPTIDDIGAAIGAAFVLWRPKDTVSGDFYWFRSTGNDHYLALADCTGHGVAGALLTVICMDALNRCLDEFHLSEPKDILSKCQELLTRSWGNGKYSGLQDGMDICLCRFSGDTMSFSSASVPLYHCRDNEVVMYKAPRFSIGTDTVQFEFEQQTIQLQNGDRVYLATDGIVDQFGGQNDKKFGYMKLQNEIKHNSRHPFSDQDKLFLQSFEGWKGAREQLDDKTFIGIAIDTQVLNAPATSTSLEEHMNS